MSKVPVGFNLEPLTIPTKHILPSRRMPSSVMVTRKYQQIKSSIQEVGLIEPLSVAISDAKTEHYILLDGHVRLLVLQELGHEKAVCLVSTDDESYTYNSRVNRLSPIQEHRMIKRAVDRGVNPERLAIALNLDTNSIVKKLTMLHGICPEAVELLKSRQFSSQVFAALRKMKPTRQLECIDLMISTNNITAKYAESILIATPESMLVQGNRKANQRKGLSSEQIAKMEQEMSNLEVQFKIAEQSYGDDSLDFVVAKGYLTRLLSNPSVIRYLKQNQHEILTELENIIEVTSYR